MGGTVTVRLFVSATLTAGQAVTLDPRQAHYVASVMRLAPGDSIHLFNGRDGEWRTEIAMLTKKSVRLSVVDRVRAQKGPTDLWLAFTPPKGPRLATLIEKATELGVAVLAPIITARSIVRRTNTERLAAIAAEAAEQCGRLTVPAVREAVSLDDLIADWPTDRRLIFCDESRTAPTLTQAIADVPPPVAVLIGPEGGFAAAERERLRAMPAVIAATLGPRILRVDTAAIAALAVYQATAGDWRR
ncbi:MAG: 16S rRNA (uracil(1498)-N(3))-methyltransferase [Alphaproteobacteria bacterium]|nr:16S rRNA (uracil(1498)-N(3))-methyltransferase [Alphaproteobacteria bacterium]